MTADFQQPSLFSQVLNHYSLYRKKNLYSKTLFLHFSTVVTLGMEVPLSLVLTLVFFHSSGATLCSYRCFLPHLRHYLLTEHSETRWPLHFNKKNNDLLFQYCCPCWDSICLLTTSWVVFSFAKCTHCTLHFGLLSCTSKEDAAISIAGQCFWCKIVSCFHSFSWLLLYSLSALKVHPRPMHLFSQVEPSVHGYCMVTWSLSQGSINYPNVSSAQTFALILSYKNQIWTTLSPYR